jgi:hypothetical protein
MTKRNIHRSHIHDLDEGGEHYSNSDKPFIHDLVVQALEDSRKYHFKFYLTL